MNVPLRTYTGLLGRYLRPQRAGVALLALLLAAGIALQLANPQIIRYFLDTAQTPGQSQVLLGAALLFIGISLVQRFTTALAGVTAENLGWKATNFLRRDLALHALRLDMDFHKTHTAGEMIERIDGDVTELANFFSNFALQLTGNALLVLGILALIFREDARAGAALTVYTLLTLAILNALQRASTARWGASRQASAEMFGYVEERIGGAEDIRSSGAEAHALYRLFHLMRKMMRARRAAFLVHSLTYHATTLLFAVGYALGLGLGVYLYLQGQATVGTAYMFVAYIGMLSGPLQQIRHQVQDLQRAAASIARVESLFALRSRLVDAPAGSTAPAASLPPGQPMGVTFSHVSFHYDDNLNGNGNGVAAREAAAAGEGSAPADVLHDLDFHLAPGQVLGVLGRTGSGKTTLTRLLFRLYDPHAGQILLDGVDLRRLPQTVLHERVGMVTQDVQLFQASVRDNLTFFNPAISDDRLSAVLKELNLWEWVQSLPHGLDTRLASGGGGLSAGEAQLLAFTRVFLKDPGLVILDEASSRLDPVTENLLERALDRLFQNRTGLIIAHRLHTVSRAGSILILENGRQVEHGPRAALAADPSSRFAGLLKTGLEEVMA